MLEEIATPNLVHMMKKNVSMSSIEIAAGKPQPFGATIKGERINFAINSGNATTMTLCIFHPGEAKPFLEVDLNDKEHRTGHVWHVEVGPLPHDVEYGYRVQNEILHPLNLVIDPYAKMLVTSKQWGNHSDVAHLGAIGFPCRCKVLVPQPFDWEGIEHPFLPIEDLIIYEMHVRGFTQHPSSEVKHPGTFLGMIEKIPYLLDLGVNAVELLPIFEFNENEYKKANPKTQEPLYNYWGYSTVNFFVPMNRYAHEDAITEFKTLVKELHRHGIEIILDVVYNHTHEGGLGGPAQSFKALDEEVYYLINGGGYYLNYSGCGNTFNTNHPAVQELILQSLRYWVTEMHIDGFRFDLASVFSRHTNGEPIDRAPIIKAISTDPLLADTKLIAEAWDAAGLYQVGAFGNGNARWTEWNGRYRDNVRCFIKGTPGEASHFATRLSGSQDMYGDHRKPTNSINFITSHDGFSLHDLVSYNHKHNLANGEDNRDGANNNDSWNCGKEGNTTKNSVLQLRQRQMRNFLMALLLSQGVPMFHMGDEYGHTKEGNNNTWCQDNSLNWFLWEQLDTNSDFSRFTKKMIRFRHDHPILCRKLFLTDHDIEWHGITPHKPNWDYESRFVAFSLKDKETNNDLYVAFNAHHLPLMITLPSAGEGRRWYSIVNTALAPPYDYSDEPILMLTSIMRMISHSAIILQSLIP